MKSTLSEGQIRGLLAICESENGDAVRVTPVEQKYVGEPRPMAANEEYEVMNVSDHLKASDLIVDVYGVGGWTEGYLMRPSGRWCLPASSMWREPAEGV